MDKHGGIVSTEFQCVGSINIYHKTILATRRDSPPMAVRVWVIKILKYGYLYFDILLVMMNQLFGISGNGQARGRCPYRIPTCW